ncbi:MAG: hypothetical protein ACYTGO_09265, partial [Planctomycetota bacterium]
MTILLETERLQMRMASHLGEGTTAAGTARFASGVSMRHAPLIVLLAALAASIPAPASAQSTR